MKRSDSVTLGRGQVSFAKAKPRTWIDRLMRRPQQFEDYKPLGQISGFSLDVQTKPLSRGRSIVGRLRTMLGLLVVLAIAGCAPPDRYTRLLCDRGTGDAYLVDFWVGQDTTRVSRVESMDAECHARMGIKDAPAQVESQ